MKKLILVSTEYQLLQGSARVSLNREELSQSVSVMRLKPHHLRRVPTVAQYDGELSNPAAPSLFVITAVTCNRSMKLIH